MTVVEVRYKGGPSIGVAEAHFIRWEHTDKAGDVITYRVIKEAVADPYAELKAAAKDPTKQIRLRGAKVWVEGDIFVFDEPPENYEIRDKPKKIKLLAWVGGNGELVWRTVGYAIGSYWKRVPSEDKEVEIEP